MLDIGLLFLGELCDGAAHLLDITVYIDEVLVEDTLAGILRRETVELSTVLGTPKMI